MNKKILTPLRSYSNERVYYIYKELIIEDGKTYNIIYAKHKGGAQ